MSDNLELKQPHFAEGQKEFRDKYRENLKGFYNGYVQVLLVYAIGALGLFYFISHIENVLWWEWAIVPLTLMGAPNSIAVPVKTKTDYFTIQLLVSIVELHFHIDKGIMQMIQSRDGVTVSIDCILLRYL